MKLFKHFILVALTAAAQDADYDYGDVPQPNDSGGRPRMDFSNLEALVESDQTTECEGVACNASGKPGQDKPNGDNKPGKPGRPDHFIYTHIYTY